MPGEVAAAQIQGWTIVENAGDAAWTELSPGLVSRPPIYFVISLYSPIYTRPPCRARCGDRRRPPAGRSRSAERVTEPKAESGAFLGRELASAREPIDPGQDVQ